MKKTIYSCECLLENLIRMTETEIKTAISDYSILSLSDKWLLIIEELNSISFFCINSVNILKPFMHSYIICLKRKDLDDESCLNFIHFGDIYELCGNCLEVLSYYLKCCLIKIKIKE